MVMLEPGANVGYRMAEIPRDQLFGIPPTRSNPISPLAALSASRTMSDMVTGALGVNLTRRQRKQLGHAVNGFNAGRLMLFQSLNNRGAVTM